MSKMVCQYVRAGRECRTMGVVIVNSAKKRMFPHICNDIKKVNSKFRCYFLDLFTNKPPIISVTEIDIHSFYKEQGMVN